MRTAFSRRDVWLDSFMNAFPSNLLSLWLLTAVAVTSVVIATRWAVHRWFQDDNGISTATTVQLNGTIQNVLSVLAVSVKVTSEEMAAFDAVLASAGIETRSEGLRRLMQAAGGTFVADTSLAAEMARYRASLNDVGNGVAQIAKQMQKANRVGHGTGAEFSELRLAQMRGLARFILDSADEIDLLVRRRRDAMQLEATAALREFAHAAE